MRRNWFSRRKAPETIHVDSVLFLREQDGEIERGLKRELTRLFQQRSDVEAASLVVVSYEPGPDRKVALCVTGVVRSERVQIAKAVSGIFASMFGVQEHLDIMFPSESQRTQLEQAGRPFFVRGAANSASPRVSDSPSP